MGMATLVLLGISPVAVLLGLIPCLGWLNWFGGVFCIVTVILAIIGFATDKDPERGTSRHPLIYLLGLVGGLVLAGVAALRLLLGGGVI